MYFSRFKIFSIVLICLLGVLIALPNAGYSVYPFQQKVNLGLELQGGAYLQLLVDFDTAYQQEMQQLALELKKELRKQKIRFESIKADKDTIRIQLSQESDRAKVQSIAQSFQLQFDDAQTLRMRPDVIEQRNTKKMQQSIEVITRRVNETGTKEPDIYQQGKDRIVVQLPGTENPEDIKKLLGQTGRLTFQLVKQANVAKNAQPPSSLYELLPGESETAQGETVWYWVEKEVLLTGDSLEKVKVSQHEGSINVVLEFGTVGAKKFGDITLEHVGQQLAIIFDGKVVSAPVINSYIPFGIASISGNMDVKTANQLRTILSSGALPAPLKVLEERTVGPSLGNDAIQDGTRAVLISFGLVALFMIGAYRMLGVFAVVSLCFNLIFIFAALSMLGATLTLPGIAGLALTIGMAVDANVLIYERIKEETRAGLRRVRAIAMGFEQAMRTILDSNITTLIGAAVLYEFGSGSIRGFAVTLTIGILASMFTALTLTYMQIYLWMLVRKRPS